MALHNTKKYCWNGACIDTGAQFTVIRLAHARAYCMFFGIPVALSISKRVFVFGVEIWNSLGILHVPLPTSSSSSFVLEVDVVLTNSPMLLALDVLCKSGLSADTVRDVLNCTENDWELTLVRKPRHLYFEWSATDRILYTKSELQKLHRNFSHPSTQKLFDLLRRPNADDLNASTRAVLSDIENACGNCQLNSSKPLRLQTTISSQRREIIFR
jgi:hypothetical protein